VFALEAVLDAFGWSRGCCSNRLGAQAAAVNRLWQSEVSG
jgi:hypothetical protein